MGVEELLRFAAALIFVLSLMGLMAWLLKKWGENLMIAGQGGSRRLGIIEILPLDRKRRLILLRCDTREHLVILGESGETVLQSHELPDAAENQEASESEDEKTPRQI